MTKDAKKVWKELEKMGWSNQPKDFHLEYFEDIIKATKQALNIPDVVGQSEQCEHDFEPYYNWCSELAGYRCEKCGVEKD
jgi:hypothetical protein